LEGFRALVVSVNRSRLPAALAVSVNRPRLPAALVVWHWPKLRDEQGETTCGE
jgi:hypothetical protein